MNEWTGKLSRIDAIRIIERATDKEDPAWLWSVEDWYDEDTDTLPSIYHVMAALDVTESEYREATGAQNLNWPDESDSELTTLRARVQELENKEYDWQYPRDVFYKLIEENSPYAFYLFQWVPYQKDAKRWRLKMLHDVRTFDGREEYRIWPNGEHCGSFHDDEVEFIRISKDQHGYKWKDPRTPPPEDSSTTGEPE